MRARLQLNFAGILMIGTAIASSQLFAPSLQAQESEAKSTAPAPSRLSSPFRRAIQRGLEPGGDIVKELRTITDRTITSRRDAEAVINALASLTPEQLTARRLEYDNSSPLFYLAMWFECINYSPSAATTTFAEKGIPELIKCYDAVLKLNQKDNEKDLILLLTLLVSYKAPEAADRIVEAARTPLAPYEYGWLVVFESLANDYPDTQKILAAFSEKLPAEPLALRLLQFANEEIANEKLKRHPFDSPAGYALLNQWLSNTKDADLSMAALSAIPFLVDTEQEKLLEQAVKSPFKQIRLRGATQAVDCGLAFGLDVLAELCTDVGYSKGASDRLRALDRADLIPKDISEPEFLAKAKLSHWLQVNTERSDAPSEMKILDSRVLSLPAESDNQTYYLIQYRYSDPFGFSSDKTNIGLVGKNVYCIVDFVLPSRPIEDIYAIYASFLAKEYGFMEDRLNTDRAELSNWLPQWQGPELTDVVIRSIITLDRKLDLPNYKIAVGTAQLNGEPGWMIFDGSRSTWYPQSEQPKYESLSIDGTKPEISMIHVGRLLLDFSLEEKGRPKHLAVTPSPKPPAEVVAAYTGLIKEIPKMSLKLQRECLSWNGPINSKFDDCVNALSELNGSSKEEALIQLYEKLFAAASLFEEPAKTDALKTDSPMGEHFLTYIKFLLANNRRQDALDHCSKFESHWTPYYGFSLLAQAYILAGAPERAEPFLTELFDFSFSTEVYVLEAGLLAELWKNNNEIAKSQKLLIDCLKQLRKRVIITNRINFNATEIQMYQDLHKKFVELYPNEKSKLDSAGLPADPTVKP